MEINLLVLTLIPLPPLSLVTYALLLYQEAFIGSIELILQYNISFRQPVNEL